MHKDFLGAIKEASDDNVANFAPAMSLHYIVI